MIRKLDAKRTGQFYNSKKIPVVPSFLTNNEDESKPLQ